MTPVRNTVRLVALTLLLGACGGDTLSPPDVVARIDGREVLYREFEGYLRRNSIDLEVTLEPETLSRLFDQYLDEKLVHSLAVERGLIEESEPAAAGLSALVAGEAEVDGAEVERYYLDHPAQFERPERVRLSQILTETREAAEEALEALATGEPFDRVAQRLSTEPAAARGGNQGVLTREDVPPAFAETIFALGVGEASGVVVADYGFHIFQVTARWPAERVSLEDAAADIREALVGRRRSLARDRVVEEARRRYNVAIDERNLPFRYQGSFAPQP